MVIGFVLRSHSASSNHSDIKYVHAATLCSCDGLKETIIEFQELESYYPQPP